ncbi:hypothetical protein PMAYCL1PPCAC_16401 [Pristionchus mayeri]|uniref:Uncharacterized protein n=1 Tax=Pristionchus mayeri TaxID=1317129 RepID=A0AAN5CKM7_9BILA|nr:hypothetical protein PMAYCL1PPCAC_16401 [Pristionchus mayeri]
MLPNRQAHSSLRVLSRRSDRAGGYTSQFGLSSLHFPHSIDRSSGYRVWELKRKLPEFRTLLGSMQDVESSRRFCRRYLPHSRLTARLLIVVKHDRPVILLTMGERFVLGAKLVHLLLGCIRERIHGYMPRHVVLQATTVVHLDLPHLRTACALLGNTRDSRNLLLLWDPSQHALQLDDTLFDVYRRGDRSIYEGCRR